MFNARNKETYDIVSYLVSTFSSPLFRLSIEIDRSMEAFKYSLDFSHTYETLNEDVVFFESIVIEDSSDEKEINITLNEKTAPTLTYVFKLEMIPKPKGAYISDFILRKARKI